MTMHHITTITATGGETVLEFSSIPQTFTHLQLRCNFFANATGSGNYQLGCTLNGDDYPGTGLYTWHNLEGNGSSVASGFSTANWNHPIGNKNGFATNTTNTTTTPSVSIADFVDYRNTSKNRIMRSIAGNDNNGSGWVGIQSGMRNNTAALTSIKLWCTATGWSMIAGSTFSLYGITSNQIATGA